MSTVNPYEPPRSDVSPAAAPISSRPPFSSGLLRSAAWMNIALIILMIPYTLESVVPDFLPVPATIVLGVLCTLLPIYVMYALMRYVEFRYEFRSLRQLFYVISIVGLILAWPGISLAIDDSDEFTSMLWFALLGMPLYGIPYAMFGFRLKRIAYDSQTLTTLAWLTIVTGLSLASIVLAMLAALLFFAWYWVCAGLLFSAAREITDAGYP